MSDNDAEEPPRRSNWPIFAIFGMMGVCVVVSLVVYQRAADRPASLSDSGFSFTQVETDKPRAVEPMQGRRWEGPGIGKDSSLKMVEPTADDSILSSVSVGSGAAKTAPAAAPEAARAEEKPKEAPGEPPKLTPGEEKVLDGIVGKWSKEKALEVAGQPGLVPGLVLHLLGYPRIIGALMNNQLLVDTFMHTSGVQAACNSKSSLANFLGNPGKTGVSPWATMLKASSRYPDATKAIMESAGATTFLRCGAVAQVSGDPATIAAVMTKNPALADVLPTFMQALAHNPSAKQLYSDVSKLQTSMGALAKPN